MSKLTNTILDNVIEVNYERKDFFGKNEKLIFEVMRIKK